MKFRLLALLALLAPEVAVACRAAPHTASAFHSETFAALRGCAGQGVSTCQAEGITAAWYEMPTTRYAHGVLGDAIEGGQLRVYSTDTAVDSCGTKSVVLDDAHVFEDTGPRLADLNGDGRAEVITVRSHQNNGAQLAIYADVPGQPSLQLIATNPYIGTRNRWLAPIGIADLDDDGHIEIAYIDRPHLAKTLRVWRFKDGELSEIAAGSGLTNHRIGERDIAGGIRDCGQGPEMITANADWSRVIATRLENGELRATDIGSHVDRSSFATAIACNPLP